MEDPHHHHPTTIRLLCNTKTAGGVIGHLGHFIKQLVRTTGAKIKLQQPPFKCCDRVIFVTGSPHQDRSIVLGGEKWKMSQLQEALLRVFERVLEVEGSEREIVGCSVLAGPGQVAGVIGVAGSVINSIEKRCGTRIRISSASWLRGCADAGDELIQITGEAVAVKQTLLAISCRLQEKKPRVVLNHMSSKGKDRVLVSPEYTSKVVTFRLLCSHKVAGGLIGVGGGLVKSLEVEIGASIQISKPLATPTERIVTITAWECPESFPSAQNAVIRIFSRSVELELDNEMDPGSSLHTERTITAQLIVDPNQVSFLIDSEGMISSDISNSNGVEMQLSWGSIVADNAAKSDYILQISGLYENVRKALLQVTSRLRNLVFSTIFSNGAEHVHNCCSMESNFTSSDRERAVYCGSDDLVGFSPTIHDVNITEEMDRLGFVNEPLEGYETKDPTDNSGGFGTIEIGLEKGSVEVAVSTNSIEVIEVPEQALNCIYGESGSNLARMNQISGASIVVEDPCAGKSYRNVIISGTQHSIMVARSLLKAFILPQL